MIASADDIDKVAAAVDVDPSTDIVIDVEAKVVHYGNSEISIEIPDSARDAFLAAQWDPIGELLDGEEEISETARKLSYMKA